MFSQTEAEYPSNTWRFWHWSWTTHRLMIESRSHADVSFHISTHLPKQSTQKKLALYKQHLTLPCSWFSFYNCLIVRLQRPAPPDCVIYITCSLLKEALRFDEALHIPALRTIVIIQLFHLFRTNLTGAAESKGILKIQIFHLNWATTEMANLYFQTICCK